MIGFSKFVPAAALKNPGLYLSKGLTRLFHTYRSLTVRRDATSSNSQNNGLTSCPPDTHLVRETCLAAGLPQRAPQETAVESPPHLTEGQRQADRWLAADRELDLLVYGRPS